ACAWVCRSCHGPPARWVADDRLAGAGGAERPRDRMVRGAVGIVRARAADTRARSERAFGRQPGAGRTGRRAQGRVGDWVLLVPGGDWIHGGVWRGQGCAGTISPRLA